MQIGQVNGYSGEVRRYCDDTGAGRQGALNSLLPFTLTAFVLMNNLTKSCSKHPFIITGRQESCKAQGEQRVGAGNREKKRGKMWQGRAKPLSLPSLPYLLLFLVNDINKVC